MIFDTHTHYDDSAYDEDREELLKALPGQGVGRICNMGASMQGARDSVLFAKEYGFIYAAVGVHPDEVYDLETGWDTYTDGGHSLNAHENHAYMELMGLARRDKVVAIGEIGLDYHGFDVYEHKPPKDLQQYWFRKQLELAMELNLPAVIHSRNASQDTMEMMRWAHSMGLKCADIHCYSYSKEAAEEYVDMGFYLGFGGTCTYEGQKKLTKALNAVPLERILLETDCPYLTPEPVRVKGEWSRNTSANLPWAIKKIAEIKGLTPAEVEQATWDNANRFYGIG